MKWEGVKGNGKGEERREGREGTRGVYCKVREGRGEGAIRTERRKIQTQRRKKPSLVGTGKSKVRDQVLPFVHAKRIGTAGTPHVFVHGRLRFP